MTLAEENLGLAHYLARRLSRPDRPDEYEYRLSEAFHAFVDAERTFDPARGTFAAYAGFAARRRIGGAIAREIEVRKREAPLFLHGEDGEEIERPEAAHAPDLGTELLAEQLRRAVAGLPPREQRVLRARYWGGETLEAVAQELGISRSRVAQLERRALASLRAQGFGKGSGNITVR